MSAEKNNYAPPAQVPSPAYHETELHQPMPIEPDHAYIQPQNSVPQPQHQQVPPVQSQYATATPLHTLQKTSAPVDCPACGQREMSQVIMESGNSTHAWAAILCCCLCMGCLPYLTSSLKDAHHHCAKCGVLLATWHNSGRVEVVQRPGRKEKK